MSIERYIKLFTGKIITESRLNKDTKIQLLNHVKESNIYDVLSLLLDGKIQYVHNDQKPVVLKRFKESELPNKVKHFIKEDLPYLGTLSDMSDPRISKRISDNYKDCHNSCEKREGKGKQICQAYCKINGLQSIIGELRNSLSDCNYRQNPDECNEKIYNLIDKLEEKVNKQAEKIEKYKQELEQQKQEE